MQPATRRGHTPFSSPGKPIQDLRARPLETPADRTDLHPRWNGHATASGAQPQREAADIQRSEFASPVSLSSLCLPVAKLISTKPRAPGYAWKARRISVEGRAPEYRDGPAHLSARGPGPRTRPNGNVGGGPMPLRGARPKHVLGSLQYLVGFCDGAWLRYQRTTCEDIQADGLRCRCISVLPQT